MSFISYHLLRRITFALLLVALITWGVAKIHQQFFTSTKPAEQAVSTCPAATPTPKPTPPWQVVPGRIKGIEDNKLTLETSEGEKGPYTIPKDTPIYRLDPHNPESSFPFEDMYSDDFSQKSAVSEINFSGIAVGDVAYLVFRILPDQSLELNKVIVSEVIEE